LKITHTKILLLALTFIASLVIQSTHYHSPQEDDHESEECSLCLHIKNNHYFLIALGLKLLIDGTVYHQPRSPYTTRIPSVTSVYFSRAPPI